MVQVALTDLGVSKMMTSTQRSSQTNTGTDLWKAPEILGENPTYGHPADVFGFGLIAIFILTNQFPLGSGFQGKYSLVPIRRHVPINSHASYFWKSTGSNKRSVPINRTESSNWHQRVSCFLKCLKVISQVKLSRRGTCCCVTHLM